MNKQEEEISKLNRLVRDLEQMLMNMQSMRIGRKSEQIKPEGMQMSFLENGNTVATKESGQEESVEVTTYSRGKNVLRKKSLRPCR